MASPDETARAGGAPVTTVRLQNIAQSYGQSAALMAAAGLGEHEIARHGCSRFYYWYCPNG